MKELLTANETMELLSISRNSLDRFIQEGILKAYRLKRKLYFKQSEIWEALVLVNPSEKIDEEE